MFKRLTIIIINIYIITRIYILGIISDVQKYLYFKRLIYFKSYIIKYIIY